MGYGMKYTKGGFPFKTDPKKAKKSTTTAHGQLNDAEAEYQADLSLEQKEDAAGVGPGSNRKVMKDGSKNRVHGVKTPGNWVNPYAVKPNRKKGPVKPKPGDMKKYSDLEKHDDDR